MIQIVEQLSLSQPLLGVICWYNTKHLLGEINLFQGKIVYYLRSYFMYKIVRQFVRLYDRMS